jgi:hypothetical protein
MKGMLMVVALIAGTTAPALACHHFRVWHYRWPQRCPVALDSDRGSVRPIRLDTAPPPSEQVAKPPEAGASGATPAPAASTPLSEPGPSVPTEAQAKSSSTPQPAPAGPPSAEKASGKLKVNDVPVNPLD